MKRKFQNKSSRMWFVSEPGNDFQRVHMAQNDTLKMNISN